MDGLNEEDKTFLNTLGGQFFTEQIGESWRNVARLLKAHYDNLRAEDFNDWQAITLTVELQRSLFPPRQRSSG